MLVELRLENYAVIDNVAVEFAPGLNLLSGETGAGKSILIDALTLLLGGKASSDVIRTGADKAVVSAVFDLEGKPADMVAQILDANGLNGEDLPLILRREIAASGRGRVFLNNQPATVAVLKQIGPHLAVVHAQNESIANFDESARRGLLDTYAENDSGPVAEAFAQWRKVGGSIAELEQDEQNRLKLLDLWTFQSREIEHGQLHAGEDERLETEKRVLANSEKVFSAAMNAYNSLYEGNGSAAASVRSAEKNLEELARYEPKFEEARMTLAAARISVEDVGASLRDYAGGIQSSPERLAEVEDRLALLDRLKRKYGPTLHHVILHGEDVARRLGDMDNKEEILRELHQQLAAAAGAYLKQARALSEKRNHAARNLEKLVEEEINDLAMKGHFKIEVTASEQEGHWSAAGIDQVAYLISTNPGEPLRPLEQIASGGELSRVMLALNASVEAGAGQSARKKASASQRTLVFDEIDSGIGGRAAEAVGKKLKALSHTSQVLCVTHLPQIATFADHHYLIEKKELAGRSKTTVRPIHGGERTEEVARMISGAKLTEASRKHAEQMIKANA